MGRTNSRRPLIHCITNYVTAESMANAIIEAGGSPVMADDIREVEEVTASADALLLNLGTLNSARVESMLAAGRIANERGIPVVLDPVGCGMSKFRFDAVCTLLARIRFDAIRGNASEMLTIQTMERVPALGVDADPELCLTPETLSHWSEVARSIACRYRCRAIVTGAYDVDAVFNEAGIDVRTTEKPTRLGKVKTGEGCRFSARLAVESAMPKQTGVNPYLLYAITESFHEDAREEYLRKIDLALRHGVTMLQFREKRLTGAALLKLARDVRKLCLIHEVPFIVNDSVDLAVAVDADGVHLGREDDRIEEAREKLPGKIVGMTAHSYEEAMDAVMRGADYIGVGAMFPTASKPDAKCMPIDRLVKIRNNTPIPVVAIGGIRAENLDKLHETGIDGVAVIGGIFGSPDVASATETLRRALRIVDDRSRHYHKNRVIRCLSIAGSDPSGGAGIQADLKTFAAHGVYGMSAITAITVQNTNGITEVHDVSPDVLKAQLDAVFQDIRPDAVKIGIVTDSELISVIADRLRQYRPSIVVLDPVMVSSSGYPILSNQALRAMIDALIPLATLITPNIPEAEFLLGRSIDSQNQESAATDLFQRFKVPVLLKGGHLDGDKVDVFADSSGVHRFVYPEIRNSNTHGTGCTLSSAIAANLGLASRREIGVVRDADETKTAIAKAKNYVAQAIARGLNIGAGRGPLDHGSV